MSPRAVPFYCPFCGEQELRQDDAGDAAWRCDSCERRFELTFVGIGQALKQRSGNAANEALMQRSGSATNEEAGDA